MAGSPPREGVHDGMTQTVDHKGADQELDSATPPAVPIKAGHVFPPEVERVKLDVTDGTVPHLNIHCATCQ